ncbi:MAG: glycosyltransferase family 2 protein [Akkermansia sp.]
MDKLTDRKKISITTGCYNEEGNLEELYNRIVSLFKKHPEYDYEIIVADNNSEDKSRDILRKLASQDTNFKAIFNARNYGHIRSPYNAFLRATGDAVVMMCSDLQEPPEVIEQFIKKWEEGYDVVVGVRSDTKSSKLLELMRACYYLTLRKFSDSTEVISKFTGFGLYSKKFQDACKCYHDPYPYFRGMVSEIGLKRAEVPFVQDKRKYGITKNNFFTLYDMAMTGFVNHTRMPLRLAVFSGFIIALMSLFVAFVYMVYKIVMWDSFSVGLAPVAIGLFFFSAIQLIFIGVLGEYLGAVWIQVKQQPLVIEDELLNFDSK